MPFLDANGLEHLASLIKNNYAGKNADGAVVSAGADYAEFGDWADGNPDGENRKGYFVTIATGSNDIQIADSASAITGVTTDSAGFIGNYSKGAEADASKGLVGIVGQVSVIDNGTCEVGARCMPGDDGTAVPSSNNCGYKVIERIDSTHVRILVSPTVDMIQRIKTDVSELQDGMPYYTLGLGSEIPEGADLNDYTEPGIYYIGNQAVYNTLLNRPQTSGGGAILVVRKTTPSTIKQEVIRWNTGYSHSRGYDGNWDYWKPSYPVFSAIRLRGLTARTSLTTSTKELPFTNPTQYGDTTILEHSGNGVKVNKSGIVLVRASLYLFEGFNVNDLVHLEIYRGSSNELDASYRITNASPYQVYSETAIVHVSAGNKITVHSHNGAARGTVDSSQYKTQFDVVFLRED